MSKLNLRYGRRLRSRKKWQKSRMDRTRSKSASHRHEMLRAPANLLNRKFAVIACDQAERLRRHFAGDVDRINDQIHDGVPVGALPTKGAATKRWREATRKA